MEPHIQTFGGYGYPKKRDSVHPMCAAMSRTQLKYVTLTHDGSNATFSFGEYPKYDVGGPLTDLMRINESCISIPPCQKCCCEPMLRVEERGMKNKHCWMQCTGCKNRTVVRSVEILAIRDWSQGDMWSEPPQAHAGRYFPKEIADAINAGKHVESSATPSAAEECVEAIQTRTGQEWIVRLSKDLLTISDEHGEILHRSRGHILTGVYLAMLIERDRNLQATPSAAVGADGPVDDVTEWCDGAKEFCERQVESDTVPRSEYDRVVKLNHHLREVAVMAIVERVPSDTEEADWKRRQKIRKAAKEYSESTTADYEVPSDSKPTNVRNPESEDTPPHNPVMGPVVGTATVTFHDQSKPVSPEVGKRYVCRNGEITGVVARDSEATTYPFNAIVPSAGLTSWTSGGRVFTDRLHEHDLIAEYHESEPSPPAESPSITVPLTEREKQVLGELSARQELPEDRVMIQALRLYQASMCSIPDIPKASCDQPAESPEDWVMITDPKHVLRSCDEVRYAEGSWHPCRASVGATRGTQTWEEFRCRRKDLPVVPADKPRMRQVTLRECKMGDSFYWITCDSVGVEPFATGRTAVVEVPE